MRSKWIIALGAMVFDAILLFIGSFFLYWGAWNYLFGSVPAGLLFGPLMMIFGGSMIILGVKAILKTIGFIRRTVRGNLFG